MSAKFEFIDAQKADFPLVRMCEWAEVSTSGYYEWRDRPASATAIRRKRLTALVKAVFEHSDQTYGYRRVHAQLVRQGEQVSPELVRELMRELELLACQPRPYRPTTTSPGDPGPIPDLVNRDFTAQAPGQKMVGDITYIQTWQGWMYLATVIDCYTKACIGYAMADHLRAELAIDALAWPPGITLSPRAQYSTPIAVHNIPARPSRPRRTSSASGNRSGPPEYASTTPSPNPSMPP